VLVRGRLWHTKNCRGPDDSPRRHVLVKLKLGINPYIKVAETEPDKRADEAAETPRNTLDILFKETEKNCNA